MKLTSKIKVCSKYKGSSKFDFWKKIIPGDIIEASFYLQPTGRGGSGLYANNIILKNGYDTFTCSVNEACKYLEKIDFVEVND